MKKKITAVSASIILSTITSTSALAIDVAADIELDLLSEDSVYTSGGRVAINVTGETRNGDNFVSGKASALQGISGDSSVDDAWIQFGSSSWALKIGRFEALNLLPQGKDVYLAPTGVTGYNGNTLRGRLGGNGVAFTTSFSDSLSFELDTAWGNLDGANGDDEEVFNGFRPVITYTSDTFSISVGAESIDAGTYDISGAAVTVAFNVAGGAVNASIASADDASSTNINYTSGNFGGGFQVDDDGDNDGSTVYAAYTFSLLNVDGATLTLAASSGEDVSGVKARFNYGF